MLSAGSMPVFSENQKTVLTGLMVIPENTDTEALNEMLRQIAEETDVNVVWEEKTEYDWQKEKEERLASGKLPDVLFNAVNDRDAEKYPSLLRELSLLSFRFAPALQEMFSDEPDTLAMASNADERIYCLPSFLGVEPACETVMFINRAWLDKLNLSLPQTLNDLKTVLKAFRDNDCNGNGDSSDEIPLDFYGWFGSGYSITNLIGSWGVQLTNGGSGGFFAENGEVKNCAVDERYRAMLLFANELYAEGLISETAIKGEKADYIARSHGKNGYAIVGVAMGRNAETQFGAELKDQYVPLPPLDNSDDMLTSAETRWSYDYSGLNIQASCVSVSAGCAFPEAAMRFLNAFYRSDHSQKTFQSGLAGVLPVYIRRNEAMALSPEKDAERAEREPYAEALSNIDMVTEYYPQAFMNYTADEQAQMVSILNKMMIIAQQWWPRFLTGSTDIPTNWDKYVSQIDSIGFSQLLSIRQHAFEAYQGK